MSYLDVVTVYHGPRNFQQHLELFAQIELLEGDQVALFAVDNWGENRGHAAGANLGASQGSSSYILFLNPDAKVHGKFVHLIREAFDDPQTIITGDNFGKPLHEVKAWGCKSWVCGAALAVRRDWFESVGGFDPAYRFGFDDTDLCRKAESQGYIVRPIRLPISHSSPDKDTKVDEIYKRKNFNMGAKHFANKWGANRNNL